MKHQVSVERRALLKKITSWNRCKLGKLSLNVLKVIYIHTTIVRLSMEHIEIIVHHPLHWLHFVPFYSCGELLPGTVALAMQSRHDHWSPSPVSCQSWRWRQRPAWWSASCPSPRGCPWERGPAGCTESARGPSVPPGQTGRHTSSLTSQNRHI